MGWFTQDENDDARVDVRWGYDSDSGKEITEIEVYDRSDNSGSHVHLGFDQDGNQVFESRS